MKFKIGDKIKIKKESEQHCFDIGEVVEIIGMSKKTDSIQWCRCENAYGTVQVLTESELK